MKWAGSLLGAILGAMVPALAAAAGAVLLSDCASCQSTVRQISLPALAAGQSDAAVTDPRAHRLYLADGAAEGIDVVNISTTTPRYAGTIVRRAAERVRDRAGDPPPVRGHDRRLACRRRHRAGQAPRPGRTSAPRTWPRSEREMEAFEDSVLGPQVTGD